jgi:hypothetical protein
MRSSDDNSSEYETVCRQFLSNAASPSNPLLPCDPNIKAKAQLLVHRQRVMDNQQWTLYGRTRVRSITICGGTRMIKSPGQACVSEETAG